MQKLSPAEADRLYRLLSGEILAYLSEMDAAPHWLNDMMRIPSDELHMIPEEQIWDELEGDARAMFDISSLAQWKFSLCGGLTKEEFDDVWALAPQKSEGTLPKKMEGYYSYVERRLQETTTCGNQAVEEARWRLRSADPRPAR